VEGADCSGQPVRARQLEGQRGDPLARGVAEGPEDREVVRVGGDRGDELRRQPGDHDLARDHDGGVGEPLREGAQDLLAALERPVDRGEVGLGEREATRRLDAHEHPQGRRRLGERARQGDDGGRVVGEGEGDQGGAEQA